MNSFIEGNTSIDQVYILHIFLCMYMYIYILTHYIYIHIHIYSVCTDKAKLEYKSFSRVKCKLPRKRLRGI
jgi:predicted ferric reductase